jgi:hypothetical protein
MPLNPIETLNVFREDLQEELNKRSRSKELVRTRAPFLRFTTGANMSDLETKFGSKYSEYKGYTLFTLGLHGWDNLNYSSADIYGTKADRGLIIGTTYKNNEQKLVYTHEGQDTSYIVPNTGGGNTLPLVVTVTGKETNRNYPPPGITSATVERLRNGNVLRFNIQISCYTQQQLEMLDIVSFVPGMTAILDWGSVSTTPTGTVPLTKILDFKNSSHIDYIKNIKKTPRTKIIEEWCKPNNFNYDFAVARIANVKTEIVGNVYEVTVIAYGQADNIMYVSAYATGTPLSTPSANTIKDISVSQYFKLNGTFSKLLHDIAALPPSNPSALAVLQFSDPDDVKAVKNILPTSQTLNVTNDLGFEDTFFIRFDFLVDYFFNNKENGLLKIINDGIKTSDQLDFLISPLVDGNNKPLIYVGYHQDLRSTSPAVMIINNVDKRNRSNSDSRDKTIKIAATAGITISRSVNQNRINDVNQAQGTVVGGVNNVFDKLNASQFKSVSSQMVSDAVGLSNGVFVNSKAVQSAFLNSRTWAEGLETLLRNINAATENYWDLKLYHDDDIPGFRILDDNLRRPEAGDRTKPIYTFNKKLTGLDNDTIGPDVLDIRVSTDYPKMLFSQIAISGLNNTVSSPERKETDFIRARVVDDVFSPLGAAPPTTSTPATSATTVTYGATVSAFVESSLRRAPYTEIATTVQNALNEAGFGATNIPQPIEEILKGLFSIETPIDTQYANAINSKINSLNPKLTPQQLSALKKVFAARTVAIINKSKQAERDRFTLAYDTQAMGGSAPVSADAGNLPGNPGFTEEKKKKVIDNITTSQNTLITLVNSKIQ